MLTTLASRDTAYAERDVTLADRDAAVTDRDAHLSYADEIADLARVVLVRQDGTIRTTFALLRRIDAMERELRSAPRTRETAACLSLLAHLTLDL